MISIISLIYRSPCYADFVFNSLYQHTPELLTGDAEFFFVANDATEQVLTHLKRKNYLHKVWTNKKITEKELFNLGYAAPLYIHYVYKAWNYAITCANGDIVVLVNSDMAFSPNWLSNLLSKLTKNTFVCSQLVERFHPKYGVFPKAIKGDFGHNPETFLEEKFLEFAKNISENSVLSGGAYMPCAFYKQQLINVGMYPEGNIAGKSFNTVEQYGDQNLIQKLADNGIQHITAQDSIVYHFKEGEMEE